MPNIKHIHLEECKSTQTYLKENFSENENNLVSTRRQTEGIGRTGASWNHLDNSLAFSFSLKHETYRELTPIAIGVLFCQFSKSKFESEIGLKWPNDIMKLTLEKCGGIICHLKDDYVHVGIGVNVGKSDANKISYRTPANSLSDNIILEDEQYKNIPLEFYSYVLDNPLSKDKVIEEWNKLCVHKNKNVTYLDGETEKSATFIELGNDGSAILDFGKGHEKIISGSLIVL